MCSVARVLREAGFEESTEIARGPVLHSAAVLRRAAFLLLSGLIGLALLEIVLRVGGYRFSPLRLLPAPAGSDLRAFHAAAFDRRLSKGEPVTVFDPVLLWRLNPAATSQINEQGYRGPLMSEDRDPRRKLVVALGDSNTLGPLVTTEHWPGDLQVLIDLNQPEGEVQVVNAGVYGYSAFQGLRRFEQVLRFRPDLVYFSFGANDAHPVRLTDADYAHDVAWLRNVDWLRASAPLFHLARAVGGVHRGPVTTHRVPLPEYRELLEAFVRRARGLGVVPVLLTRPHSGSSRDEGYWLTYAPAYNEVMREVAESTGVAWIDMERELRGSDALFVDDSHLNDRGYRRMAALLADQLVALGLVQGSRRHGSAARLGGATDGWPELEDGWWPAEEWGAVTGRWTRGEAVAVLERSGSEAGLSLDLSLNNPMGTTAGRVEVNGRTLWTFREGNGRVARRLDLRDVPGAELRVRLAVDRPFVPHLHDPADPDERSLGMFVHGLELTASHLETGVDPGEVDDPRAELEHH